MMSRSKAKKLTGRAVAFNLKAPILFEPAAAAPTLAPAAPGPGPPQLEVLPRPHRPPAELRISQRRHRHIIHPPARRRHHIRRQVHVHRNHRVVPRAQARQHEVVALDVHVVGQSVGAIEDAETSQIRGVVEHRAREAEVEGTFREAEARVADVDGRGLVVDVVDDEVARSREAEDCLVAGVASEVEARVAAPGRLEGPEAEREPDHRTTSRVA